ncbi:MAG TPA: MbnP family copper-binding protein [Kofleriaceae bacterium]
MIANPIFKLTLIAACALPGAAGCGSDDAAEPTAFSLRFAAQVDGKAVGCTDDLAGFGPDQTAHIGLNDLRFYVSNLAFHDGAGEPVALTLDQNEFQYAADAGAVAMIDLTGNTEGSCSTDALAAAEGTARTHLALTGTTRVADVAQVSFDVGVPQALMKQTIATTTPEGAPSPLDEMYWSWNSGYRHLVFNFTVTDGAGATGAGYLHIGSRDCAGSEDGKALEDRDRCTYVNTPAVALAGFDLAHDTVGLDLRKLISGVGFIAPIYDPVTFEVIGQGPGVACHSSPTQPDCAPIFHEVGVDMATGTSAAASDVVFAPMP